VDRAAHAAPQRRLDRLGCGFLLAFMLALVRFVFAT